jgi:hypothetical protein
MPVGRRGVGLSWGDEGQAAVMLSRYSNYPCGGCMTSDSDADQRQPHVRPELRTYGAITRLVQGGSGISFEGGSGMVGMS